MSLAAQSVLFFRVYREVTLALYTTRGRALQLARLAVSVRHHA